ncbi:MAG: hypothetical protein ABFE08_15695 [Armatimonadia bacterium]
MRILTASLLFALSLTLVWQTAAPAEGGSDVRLEWGKERPAGDSANRNPQLQPGAQKLLQQLPLLPQTNSTPSGLRTALNVDQPSWLVGSINQRLTGPGLATLTSPAYLYAEPQGRHESNGHVSISVPLRLTGAPFLWGTATNAVRGYGLHRLLRSQDSIGTVVTGAVQTNRAEGGQK